MKREIEPLEEQYNRLKQERRQLKKRHRKLLLSKHEESEQSEEHKQLMEQIELEIKQNKEEIKPLGELLEKKRKPLKWKETLEWLRDEQKCLVSF